MLQRNRALRTELAVTKAALEATKTERDAAIVNFTNEQAQAKYAGGFQTAWLKIFNVLCDVRPGWFHHGNLSSSDCAVLAIKRMAEKIEELEAVVALKTAVAGENEKKYLALEKENRDLREYDGAFQKSAEEAQGIFQQLHQMLDTVQPPANTCSEHVRGRLQKFIDRYQAQEKPACSHIEYARLKEQERKWLAVFKVLDRRGRGFFNASGDGVEQMIESLFLKPEVKEEDRVEGFNGLKDRIENFKAFVLSTAKLLDVPTPANWGIYSIQDAIRKLLSRAASNEAEALHWKDKWERLNYDVQSRSLPRGFHTPHSW